MKFFIFVTVICISLLSCVMSAAAQPLPCPIAFLCSTEEDNVWATDGRSCYTFFNSCNLQTENCARQNRYEEVLKKVSKDECKVLPSIPKIGGPAQ